MSISMSTCLSCLSIHVYLSPSKFTRLSPECMCSCLSLCLSVSPSLCLSTCLFLPLCFPITLTSKTISNHLAATHTLENHHHTHSYTRTFTHLLISPPPKQQCYVTVSEVHMVNNKNFLFYNTVSVG